MARTAHRASQRLLSVCSFGQAPVPYNVALQLQEGLTALRRSGDVPDTVLRLQVRSTRHMSPHVVSEARTAIDVAHRLT